MSTQSNTYTSIENLESAETMESEKNVWFKKQTFNS